MVTIIITTIIMITIIIMIIIILILITIIIMIIIRPDQGRESAQRVADPALRDFPELIRAEIADVEASLWDFGLYVS